MLAPGEGQLAFRHQATNRKRPRTIAETCAARSPLKILSPKNHGDFAWVYAASYGGGLVDGDRLALHVQVHPGAAALLGTQSSTKIYKSPNGCRQEIDANVGAGGSLVVLPDPVSPFAAARYAQSNRVALAEDASLVLVDTYTCGRTAHGERWDFARYSSRTRITRAGQTVFHDAVLLDAAEGGPLADRMGRFEAIALVVALGPRFEAVVRALLTDPPPLTRRPDLLAAASPLSAAGARGAVLRLAGTSVEIVTRAVRVALADLPAILGDDPFARKY